MNENEKKVGGKPAVLIWAAALAISFLLFYGMDHAIMAMQGLPLGISLSPAQ